jgi:putative transposase
MLCRRVYNAAVSERRDAWRMRGVAVSYYQQKAELPGITDAMPEYADVHSHVVQDVVVRVGRAFQAFFRRPREGRTPGYPRFHGRDRYSSFSYPHIGDHCGARLDDGFRILSTLGRFSVRWSRPMEGAPKPVTVSKAADGWRICFSCADAPVHQLPPTGQETGIDLDIEASATLSNGTHIFSPGWYRAAERALKTAQRRVSRRKEGSDRRRKTVMLLARAHQSVKRQRADFHHKTALALVRKSDLLYHEDLQTANMVKNHHLANIHDAGWSSFLTILSFKAACAGRSVVAQS